MPTNGLGQIWNPHKATFEIKTSAYDPAFAEAFQISEDEWNTYSPVRQEEIMGVAKDLGYNNPQTQTNASGGLGGWFKDNKDMIGAGLGAAQLGLGILNYNQNKKALKSELESAEQARRLNEERAQNKRTIQNKAQTALRFDI